MVLKVFAPAHDFLFYGVEEDEKKAKGSRNRKFEFLMERCQGYEIRLKMDNTEQGKG